MAQLLRHHESDSGRLGGGREGSSSMKQAKGMLLPVWGCFQGECTAHRCPGPPSHDSGYTRTCSCWLLERCTRLQLGEHLGEVQTGFLPIGMVPQPIVDKQPSRYWDVKIKKLPVLRLGAGSSDQAMPFGWLAARWGTMALLVQCTMASTVLGPKALTAVGALPHSYPYLPTDPCQGTGLWRQLLLRVEGEAGQSRGGPRIHPVEWEGGLVWAEAPSPCTSSTVSLTSFTKQKSKGNIISFKMVTAGLSILYKFTFYELSHLILITWGRYNF